jgi:predicted nucleic-acid-binding protein
MFKDNRATVKAARIIAISSVIAALIGASVFIISRSDTKNRSEVAEDKKSEINDTLKSVDAVENTKIQIEPKDHIKENAYKSRQVALSDNLRTIEDKINDQQSPSAYRSYMEFYNSLPLHLKSSIDHENIKNAEKCYKHGKWQEAALIMKENLEIIIKE